MTSQTLHQNQGINFLVSHRNLLCIFDMTAIQNIFCVAVFFHRSVQNFIWNIYPSAEIANHIWGGKLFPENAWILVNGILDLHVHVGQWESQGQRVLDFGSEENDNRVPVH